MEEHGVFNDGKSQTGAAELARTPFVYPVESLEQTIQMFFGYTHAVVREGEIVVLLVFEIAVDCDVSSPPGIGDGIVGEVSENRVEQRIVTVE